MSELIVCRAGHLPIDEAWEIKAPYMCADVWKDALRQQPLDDARLEDVALIGNIYEFCNPLGEKCLTRSQSTFALWALSNRAKAKMSESAGRDIARLATFFPVYDGVGFWIGLTKRERETEPPYTKLQLAQIAIDSANGALCEQEWPNELPDHSDIDMVYRCVWRPGIPSKPDELSVTDGVFMQLGYSIHSIRYGTKQTNFTLYGKVESGSGDGLAFKPDIAVQLEPAWRTVRNTHYPTSPAVMPTSLYWDRP